MAGKFELFYGCLGNGTTVCNTENDYVLCEEFSDGTIEKSYERHRIAPGKIEVIQHRNRDKNGNYYTTRKIIESDVVC